MTILKAENISKQYRLGLVGTGTLSHDLNRWWAGIRGKEDPYLKVGAVNDRSTKANSDYVWALQDINFEVQQGEVLGIIGKNGAGKSTLLKILSRVTSPTTGEIKTKGRIASLLEVGTGFHPEMTGRENIYLNGAILGMTKTEIKRKEDEIIEFSGCEGYIDTPVKRYSSGMRVRLAFAVAAHLEPDILVIDEVLAVGDAEFQKKCLNKMEDVSKVGRTVLFVSHNMSAIQRLCPRSILLDGGMIKASGETQKVVKQYLSSAIKFSDAFVDMTKLTEKEFSAEGIWFTKCWIENSRGKKTPALQYGEPFTIYFEIESQKAFRDLAFHVGIDTSDGMRVFTSDSEEYGSLFSISSSSALCVSVNYKYFALMPGKYHLSKLMVRHGNVVLALSLNNIGFEITSQAYNCSTPPFVKSGIIAGQSEWQSR